jgi:hypothetical protein
MEALDSADLMVILTRFRDLPDDQMKHIVDDVGSGITDTMANTAPWLFSIRKKEQDERL